jgi:hypothetical protein
VKEITISLPAIDERILEELIILTTHASANEAEAVKAIREKYATLAAHNGYIKIGHSWKGNQNWSESRDYHYKRDHRKIRGLLARDEFETIHTSEYSGTYAGTRLYLLETGEWLRIERRGKWSSYQNSPDCWACDDDVLDPDFIEAIGLYDEGEILSGASVERAP